jgi:hypothetical protein
MLGILLVSIIDFILLVVVAATTLPECNELRGTQIVAQVSAVYVYSVYMYVCMYVCSSVNEYNRAKLFLFKNLKKVYVFSDILRYTYLI